MYSAQIFLQVMTNNIYRNTNNNVLVTLHGWFTNRVGDTKYDI